MSYEVSDQSIQDFEDWRHRFMTDFGREPNRHETWEEATRRERARLGNLNASPEDPATVRRRWRISIGTELIDIEIDAAGVPGLTLSLNPLLVRYERIDEPIPA
jgi:hypothetical protein